MRNPTTWFRAVLMSVAFAAPFAAIAAPQSGPAAASSAATHSGFLSDYSLLQADPRDPAYRHYLAPGVTAAQYRKFLVERPAIIINTGGQYQALAPERLKDLVDYYQGRMAAALGRHYEVVTQPGPGVARLKVAVVAAVEVKPPLKARDFIPVSALFHVARAATGKSPRVLRMSMESEALDSQTGALLGETVDTHDSTKKVSEGEAATSAQLHQLVDFWVDRFVARLDKANGFTQ